MLVWLYDLRMGYFSWAPGCWQGDLQDIDVCEALFFSMSSTFAHCGSGARFA